MMKLHTYLNFDGTTEEAFSFYKSAFGLENMFVQYMKDTPEADKIFGALSEGGKVDMPMADMFWGDYFGSFEDKFGIQWMVNCATKPQQ